MTNLIDVTLRDGGHPVGFDWPLDFVRRYLEISAKVPEINFTEVGYWKQKGKFDGRFYKVDQRLVDELGANPRELAVMIDFHYCRKNLRDYPTEGSQPLGLIRLTSRKESVADAVVFLERLKGRTGAQTSLNIFNVSNYPHSDLVSSIESAGAQMPDLIYLADTHGAINLETEQGRFADYARLVLEAGAQAGFHLHNHLGLALQNFRLLESLGYGWSDVSLNGLGKGGGNLHLEHVFAPAKLNQYLEAWCSYPYLFETPLNPLNTVTAMFSATDHYADQAIQLRIGPRELSTFLTSLSTKERDNFSADLMRKFIRESSR